jgi:16S rRNA processing protein RimM
MDAERVLMGRISGAHGLKGEVKIATFTARPEDIAAYGSLYNSDGTRRFEIAAVKPLKGATVIARLKGVNDRTAAEALRGVELYVEREALPPAEEEEYYHSDLIGLAAIGLEGEPLGEIVAVHNFGAGDLLELRLADTGKTELVPFDTAHAPAVDLKAGIITIVRPVLVGGDSSGSQE